MRLRNARYVPRSVSVYARRSSAMPSVAPMPCPDSMYQGAAGVTPASFHSACSRMCVPDLSPRETKRAPAAAIFASAAAARGSPRILAGSASGPTMMKSLYMTRRRFRSLPSATYFFSSDGAWTSATSASPRAASASACPVPTDTGFTVRPLCFSKSGSSTSSSPESCVLVVVDNTTAAPGVWAPAEAHETKQTSNATAMRAMGRIMPQKTYCALARGSTLSRCETHSARHRLLGCVGCGVQGGRRDGAARSRRPAPAPRAEPAGAARRRRLRHATSMDDAAELAARLRPAAARCARAEGAARRCESAAAARRRRARGQHRANGARTQGRDDRRRHARPHRRLALLSRFGRWSCGGDCSLPRADRARTVDWREPQLDDTLLHPALQHLGMAREHAQHPPIVGQDPGSEVRDAIVHGSAEQLGQQQRAKPLALPTVLHDDRDLRHAVVGRLVACDANHRRRRRREIFGDEREAALVIHVGEK